VPAANLFEDDGKPGEDSFGLLTIDAASPTRPSPARTRQRWRSACPQAAHRIGF